MSKGNIQKFKASELELKEKVVNIRRVTKVTKGGRTFSFSATVVIGNGEGIVGEGLGKRQIAKQIFLQREKEEKRILNKEEKRKRGF